VLLPVTANRPPPDPPLPSPGCPTEMAPAVSGGGAAAAALASTLLLILLCSCVSGAAHGSSFSSALRRAVPRGGAGGLCEELLLPLGYPCTEHTVRTPPSVPLLVISSVHLVLPISTISSSEAK
jgi:hypothetical protein